MAVRPTYSAQSGLGVAGQVEQRLRKAIVAMELPPGARLSEQEIATQLAVSRQPVREALIKLASTGLVQIQPQRGTQVVKISADHVIQARAIREQIEAGVVVRACELGLSKLQISGLHDMIRVQREAIDQEDLTAFKLADEAFHRELANQAHLPLAWETIGDIKAHLDRVCILMLETPASMRPLILQHEVIVDCIERRDGTNAERAMRLHLRELLLALPDVIERQPDFFE
jgi:GntR family transcriptional regulator, rspAB operon transcriptional repressor